MATSTSPRVFSKLGEVLLRLRFATARARRQFELEEAQARNTAERLRLEDQGRRQDHLLAGAAHELRTPLTSITGFLQLVERDMASGRPPDPNHIQVAIEQSRRLRALVDDLTDVGQVQSGRLTLRLQELDLRDLVERTVQAIGPASDRAIEFDAPTEPVMVEGDAARLQQVFANLVNNALAHGGTGKPIRVHLRKSDGHGIVQVRDFGRGIPANELANLFLPFHQSSEERGSGLGLGLFIARELVGAHRGSIEVDSAEGHGATFTVKLPLLRRADTPA
ncbi:MAG: HAMP domain-containing histidine kinase [Chloroflexota bacterium]|nr:HAMP domain-containing histidine kinase [Chloroflexota bacterium]